jgi:hypothetical protein
MNQQKKRKKNGIGGTRNLGGGGKTKKIKFLGFHFITMPKI